MKSSTLPNEILVRVESPLLSNEILVSMALPYTTAELVILPSAKPIFTTYATPLVGVKPAMGTLAAHAIPDEKAVGVQVAPVCVGDAI